MSAVAARRLSLGAFLCSVVIFTGCSGPAKNPSCSKQSDCASGFTCKADECVGANQCPSTQASCTTNDSCAGGSSCQGGCCAPLAAGACRSSSDCASLAATPHCEATTSACVACASNSECPGGLICTSTGACLPGCSKDANCAAGQHCFNGPSGSWCGQCQQSTDCADPSKPFCTGGACTGCAANADCPSDTPVCNTATHGCVVCLESQNANGTNAACTDTALPACVSGACVGCAPSQNGGDGKNPACNQATPYCNPAGDTCVGCIDATQCKSGDYCGGDSLCHSPVLTAECIGAGSPCSTSQTLVAGSSATVMAKLDVNAITDTAVSFDMITGAASFDSGSVVTHTSATISAGSSSTGNVNVFLDPLNTNDVVIRATLGSAQQNVTIHVQATPAALTNFSSDKGDVQEGQTATLTVTFDATPASTATVTLTNDDPSVASIPASVDVSGSTTATVTFTATALASGTAHLHASYGGVTKDLSVNVFKVQVTNLTPASSQVGVGLTDQLTVTVDSAPPAGASAIVSIADSGGGGTLPASVTIPAGQTTANFSFTAGGTAGSETITASAGGATSSPVTITVAVLSPKVMVIRMGDGAAALSSTGSAAVFVEEYDSLTAGSAVRTLTIPTAISGSNQPLTMVGGATTEAGLSRSSNGKYVTFAGYAAAANTASVASTTAAATPRIVGRIDASGNIDTTTQMNAAFSTGNVRGATSIDGTNFWVTGSNTGVVYVPLGSTGASTVVSTGTPTNLRQTHIFGGQLYVTSGSSGVDGVATVGTGTPTAAGSASITILPGFPTTSTGQNPISFSVVGTDTIYEAQNTSNLANAVNVQKWKLSAGTWAQDTNFKPSYSVAAGAGAFGVAAKSTSSGVLVVASTSDGNLVSFVDDGSTETPTVTILSTAATNTAYRGVAFSPDP